ncbi:lysophospholipid acyltransferase family protein [bacterium]|nr:lysophospholipid acyltransferase family protein [bacterium]
MIAANHQLWADWLFTRYLNRLYRKHFHAFHLLGELPELDPSLPLLVTPNHSSWWDGFFVHWLNRHLLHRRLHMMMLEEQLRKHRFFARVGAFSIDPGNPLDMVRSLSYSMNLLKNPSNLVCIYPQGELQPFGTSPLPYRSGVPWLLARLKSPVTLLPLAMRIEMLGQQHPEAFFLFGNPKRIDPDGKPITRILQDTLSELKEQLRQRVDSGEKGTLIFRGRTSINEQTAWYKRGGASR